MPGQHLRYYGVSVEWAESYAFKGQKVTVLYAQKFVFQPCAELAFDVNARLICGDHSGLYSYRSSWTYSIGTLVNA